MELTFCTFHELKALHIFFHLTSFSHYDSLPHLTDEENKFHKFSLYQQCCFSNMSLLYSRISIPFLVLHDTIPDNGGSLSKSSLSFPFSSPVSVWLYIVALFYFLWLHYSRTMFACLYTIICIPSPVIRRTVGKDG